MSAYDELFEALSLMENALRLLDKVPVAGIAAAHLDLAIETLRELCEPADRGSVQG
jgi:hypothetical protein